MNNPAAASAALPVAHAVLRILIVLNWLYGAAILLLLAMPTRQWIMTSLGLSPGAEADRVILSLQAIAVFGVAAVPVNYIILARLLAIVETVRVGDPFVAANAARLQVIAWALRDSRPSRIASCRLARSTSMRANIRRAD